MLENITAVLSLPKTVLICGASARAAAFSAFRAGIQPVCADLFADEDLRAVAKTKRVENYPNDLPTIAETFPTAPWIYTGALENHQTVVEHISAIRPLLGNGPSSLARARNHVRLASLLDDAGLPHLDVRTAGNPPPPDGHWLLKPVRGAAGHGIGIWNEASTGSLSRQPPYYFQRRAPGIPCSALFVAFSENVLLIGVTKQLIGDDNFYASPFAYCGSIGPLRLPQNSLETLQRIGQLVGNSNGLRGLFGCDFLLDGETPWLTEVNPRYTASVEIYERAWGIPLLAWHCHACGETASPEMIDPFRTQLEQARNTNALLSGKAILFAPHSTTAPPLCEMFQKPLDSLRPRIADIPQAGTEIATGHPICTVFTEQKDEESCAHELHEAADRVYGNLS